MLLDLTWSDFKAQLDAGTPFRVLSIGGTYYLMAASDLFELNCCILQDGGADQIDFENNYAASAVSYSLSPLAPGNYRNITGNTTVTVKNSPGVLMGILINDNATNGLITIYDNTAGSGTKIGSINTGSPSGGLLSTTGRPGPIGMTALNFRFSTGLTVVTSGSNSNDITVVYR